MLASIVIPQATAIAPRVTAAVGAAEADTPRLPATRPHAVTVAGAAIAQNAKEAAKSKLAVKVDRLSARPQLPVN
jgi:hypothetical protein